jgi:hypothetical protein
VSETELRSDFRLTSGKLNPRSVPRLPIPAPKKNRTGHSGVYWGPQSRSMLAPSSLCMRRKAVLLDALTIFFLAAGTLLLLINIWHHPSKIILTKVDESDDARTLER